jgi:CRP-like cAMP-binding protein
MIEDHLRKLKLRAELSEAECRAITGLFVETRRARAHETLIREGQELSHSLLLVEGWLGRAKDLRRGQRGILEVHVPGDFADLHGFTLKQLDHDVIALADSKVAIAPHDRIRALLERFPRLARLYWLMTNIDAAIQREWTLSLARRPALARVAHLFCELFVRLSTIERAAPDGFDFPLSQSQLSECVGLTPVHVNRTLQDLRSQELIRLESRRLTILDRDRLFALAEFDPGYLYLRRLV